MNCPICNSEKNDNAYKKLNCSVTSDSLLIDKEVSNLICQNCGNVFNESGARYSVSSFYEENYQLHEETEKAEFKYFSNGKIITHQDLRLNILNSIIKLPERGKLLDIGCGKGNFLAAFGQKFSMWELNGIEKSKSAVSFAKKILPNANINEGFFNEQNYNEKFDFIVAQGVLEHLEDPNQFLKSLTNVLKEDGILFFEVPNFKLNSADLFTYDHLSHFSKETLENLFAINGISIIKFVESDERIPLYSICKKSQTIKKIQNYYSMMKSLLNDHIQFNESVFKTYKDVSNQNDQIGVFGLGEIGLAGIQNGILPKNKIAYFFDENDLLVGSKKLGIEILHLTEVKNHPNLPIVLSISPCYFDNVLKKLEKFRVNYTAPNNYNYYKKYFSY